MGKILDHVSIYMTDEQLWYVCVYFYVFIYRKTTKGSNNINNQIISIEL